MSKREKLIQRFKLKLKDFTWQELVTMLGFFGYKVITGEGSRRRFINEKTKQYISIHEPHPRKILKEYQVKNIYNSLEKEGLL